ncbi:MAG TPA: MFS transporter [Capillimicrobium sp.]|jgi:EmrB/QacA subfamily drug resistance transporter
MRSLLVLSIAALAFALGQTTIIPALGELQREFATDTSGVAWTLTGYLVAAAVCTPLVGRLGDMFGKQRMLVVALGFFAVGSVVSALGTSLEVVVAGRVLQGVGGGIFPLCFGIIRDEFPADRVPSSIGLISAIAGIGGGAGLVLGGVLVDNASYHWIFWAAAIMGAVALVTSVLFVPGSPLRVPGRVDVRGALVLAVGLVLPLIAISHADEWGWGSARLLGMIGAGAVVLAAWLALQRRTAEPLADVAMLARPPVLVTNLATLLVGFGMFGSFLAVPTLAQLPEETGIGFGLDATGAGLLLLPSSIVMLLVGPLSGLMATRLGAKVPLALGSLVSGAAFALLALNHGSEGALILGTVVMAVGMGLAFAAMPNLIVEAVPQAKTGEATGFNALVRSVGASLGSQVTASVIAGSAVAGSVVPTDDGFVQAFFIASGVAVLAGIAAALIPRAPRHDHVSAASEVGAASPLGDPALAAVEERR